MLLHLYHTFSLVMEDVKEGRFAPAIVFDEEGPAEYAALPLTCYEGGVYRSQSFRSMSHLLEEYYASRDTLTRIRQKSSDLRRIVQTALERNNKKYDLQLKQLKDTEKREKYRIYGELLNTYGYELTGGEKSFTCLNYYTNEEITIPLDTQLSAKDNAKKHFDKYNKLKRTYEALTDLTKETKAEIDHLESISSALDIALAENDLVQIKEELMEYGYIKKRRSSDKKPKITSKPFHYISSDGFHIYVGKNNYQNEELTFKLATGNDWWFHAKGIPGSHVIVKTEGRADLPDRLFEEAGSLVGLLQPSGPDSAELDQLIRNSSLWVNLLTTVIMAPVVEELFFRKLVMDRLLGYGQKTAIIISGIMFGMAHGNFSQFFYAFGIGILWAYVYAKTGKVRYTIGFHMLFNLLGGVVTVELSKGAQGLAEGPWMIRQIESILGVDMGWLVTAFSSIMILAYLFFMLACLIAAITLIIMYRRQITFQPGQWPLRKGRAFQTAFLNVGMIVYFVICCGLFILNW